MPDSDREGLNTVRVQRADESLEVRLLTDKHTLLPLALMDALLRPV